MNDKLIDQLGEFDKKEVSSSIQKKSAVILIFCYLFYFLVDTLFDLQRFRLNLYNIDEFFLLVFLGFPGIGLFLFIRNHKAGWVITALFFLFLAIIAIMSLIKQFNESKTNHVPVAFSWRQLLFLLISLSLSIMLLTRTLRKQFSIAKLTVAIVFTVSFLIAYILISDLM